MYFKINVFPISQYTNRQHITTLLLEYAVKTHYAEQKWDKNEALQADWWKNTELAEPTDRWFVFPRFVRSELRV